MTDQFKPIDWRGLCEELANYLQGRKDREVGWPGEDPEQDLLDRVHALLAQSEPEAVGVTDQQLKTFACEWWHKFGFVKDKATCAWIIDEIDPEHFVDFSRDLLSRFGGHPAPMPAEDDARIPLAQSESEVVELTDDSGEEWQWYTYCPEEGIELYPNRQQAQSAAQSIMGSYEVAAHSDGWHEDMESVSWGMLVPVEQAQVVERKTAEPDDEFDEWVKYELRPARYGPQPALPVEGEVGEVALVHRMCEIILGNTFGNKELDSLALFVGHHPDVLNAFPAPAGEGVEDYSDFVAWLVGEMPAGTVISDPLWWAPRIARRAAELLQCRPAPVPAGEVVQAYQAGRRDAEADARQAAEAAEGEPAEKVSELVRWLRLTGNGQPRLSIKGYERLIRAADLIEQLQIQTKC